MGLKEHAERELALRRKLLREQMKEPSSDQEKCANDMEDLAEKQVLELIDTFCAQGHSGNSALYVLQLFYHLARYEILSPLYGGEDEWTEYADGLYQNNRLSSIFKNGKEGTPYTTDGAIFKVESEEGWFTNFYSRRDVTFPLTTPKSERIVIKQSCIDFMETRTRVKGSECSKKCQDCPNFVRYENV